MAQDGERGFFYSITWMMIALGLAALVGAIAIFELRAGPIVGGLLSLVVYAFLAYGVPRRLGKQVPATLPHDVVSPSDDPRVDLLVEAHQHVQTLAQNKMSLPLSVANDVNKMALDAGIIINAVTDEPSKLTPVLRFFTYYLPATADLVTDRLKLAPHAGDARLLEIDQTLARLTEAFAGFKAATINPDLQSVDIDISLLDDALDADLEDLKTR